MPPHEGSGRTSSRLLILYPLLLLSLVLVVYYQATGYGFVDFDDGLYVYDNPHVLKGLTAEGIEWAFTQVHGGYWIPLTWLSLMADASIFGPSPFGFHLSNILLHAANVLLLGLLLFTMTEAKGRSFLAAALFAIHPINVESVVWITERKDVLSTFFMLLCMLAYVKYVGQKGRVRYLLVALLFLGGLMAKPIIVTLPFLLLLLDFWPLGRLSEGGETLRAVAKEKIPLVILSAVFAVTTLVTMSHITTPLQEIPLVLRLENSIVSYAVTLFHLIVPIGLGPLYLFPFSGLPALATFVSALTLLAVSVAVYRERRRRPYLLTGWLWYLVALLPVSGLVQNGMQAYADRFAHIPSMGFSVAAVWLGGELVRRRGVPSVFRVIVPVAALLLLTAITLRQETFWRDTESLFRRATQVDKGNWLAEDNLGAHLAGNGRFEEAIPIFRDAILHNPTFATSHFNLGLALKYTGRCGESVRHFEEALRLEPGDALARQQIEDCMRLLEEEQASEAKATDHEETRRGAGIQEGARNPGN